MARGRKRSYSVRLAESGQLTNLRAVAESVAKAVRERGDRQWR